MILLKDAASQNGPFEGWQIVKHGATDVMCGMLNDVYNLKYYVNSYLRTI